MPDLKIEMNKALRIAVDRIVREYMRNLGLREQWAALYDDGSWTEGEDRADAEAIVTRNSWQNPKPRLARRWISNWQTADEERE